MFNRVRRSLSIIQTLGAFAASSKPTPRGTRLMAFRDHYLFLKSLAVEDARVAGPSFTIGPEAV